MRIVVAGISIAAALFWNSSCTMKETSHESASEKRDSSKEQLPAGKLLIPEELRKEFQKIDASSYIVDWNKMGKLMKNFTIGKLVNT